MKILNLEPIGYSDEAARILRSIGTVAKGPLSREELLCQITDTEILIVRLGHRIDKEILSRASRLRVIVSATTGLNHIDVLEAQENNIEVLSLKSEYEFLSSISATAELHWGLLLSLLRHIREASQNVNDCKWLRDNFKGNDLSSKVIGIIGYGRIGQKIARYAAAFDMKVVFHDTVKTGDARQITMDQLFSISDIISVNVSYDAGNHHMIGSREFSLMKPDAVIINTSRGEIIDEDALLENLKLKKIKGAALDVLEGENSGDQQWMGKNALVQFAKDNKNLIITPHIGGATYESMEKTEIFMAKKLKKFLEDPDG